MPEKSSNALPALFPDGFERSVYTGAVAPRGSGFPASALQIEDLVLGWFLTGK